MKFHRIRALFLKYFYIARSVERMADIFFWPLLDVLIWGFLSYFLRDLIGNQLAFTFLLGACFRPFELRGAQDLPIFILEDYWSKNVYNIFSSPIRLSELVCTISVVSFIRSVVSFLFISMISVLVYGFNPLNIDKTVLISSLVILSIFGWCVGMIMSSFIVRFGQRIQFLVWTAFWVMQPFSCTFYPLHSLPGWAQSIAKYVPSTYVYEGFRSLASTGTLGGGLRYSLIASLVCLVIGAYLFRNSFAYAKKNALLARSD